MKDINISDSILDKKALEVYIKAYQFIIQDSLFKDQTICVSNRLINTDYEYFTDDLKIEITDFYTTSMYLEDEKQDTTNIYWGELFNAKNVQCNYMLSFSRIVGNDLFAVVELKEFFNTPFGEAYVFFFRLNVDNTFQFVYKKGELRL